MYNTFDEPQNMMPAMFCNACSNFTKGEKWLDFNSLEPCTPLSTTPRRPCVSACVA